VDYMSTKLEEAVRFSGATRSPEGVAAVRARLRARQRARTRIIRECRAEYERLAPPGHRSSSDPVRIAAVRRLVHAHPRLWRRVFDEELAKEPDAQIELPIGMRPR
jgi:hypothetical protein